VAACASLPWPPGPAAPSPPGPGPAGRLDLRGVVHVHTRASHDSLGTIAEVVRAARASGVAWVALTEHFPTVRAPEFPEPEPDVTLLPGYEVHAAGGSILALGVSGRVPEPALREPARLVEWIHAAGGLAFLGHLERSRLARPEPYRRAGFDGIELVNLHAEADERRSGLAWRALWLPRPLALRSLLRVSELNRERWACLGPRAVVGGVDAHAKFRLLGPLGGTLDRYQDVFRLLTTHVQARDRSAAAILEALRAGRSYVALEGLAAVPSFDFEAEGAGFRLRAPREARLALVCDGVEVAARAAREAWLPAPPEAAQCRAEAWLGRRLWVATSPRAAASAP
jgi:hypothetical protein